jgi:hypothetical protein
MVDYCRRHILVVFPVCLALHFPRTRRRRRSFSRVAAPPYWTIGRCEVALQDGDASRPVVIKPHVGDASGGCEMICESRVGVWCRCRSVWASAGGPVLSAVAHQLPEAESDACPASAPDRPSRASRHGLECIGEGAMVGIGVDASARCRVKIDFWLRVISTSEAPI